MRTARDTSVLFASILAVVFAASLDTQDVLYAQSAPSSSNGQPCTIPEPYTATVKTTTVQKLANGVTITRETASKRAIDSNGRNYREIQYTSKMTVTEVRDPVNHTRMVWNSTGKVVTVIHLPGPDTSPRQCQRESSSRPPLPASQALADEPGLQIEDLGTRTILGVTTTGTRVTQTIPAGTVDNDLPLTLTAEEWLSSELGLELLEIHDDPRTGTITNEITDLQRAEPDPSLFQIPDGYTVKDTYPNQQN